MQGVCVWLTGLSGSGKSTTAEALSGALAARGCRVTVIDGDALRRTDSRILGFSKSDRDANVERAAVGARQIVLRGEVAVCALISPYRDARDKARQLIGPERFIEVFVDTPLETCEARDPKALYRRWRLGDVSGVSGLDDPYEPPHTPHLVLKTVGWTVEQNVDVVVKLMRDRDFLT